MTENSPQVDESHEEAAMTLFNPSTIMLHAVSHGISPHNVRTRLLNHVAGVDPPPRPKSPVDPFQSSSSPSAPSSSNSQSNTDRTSTTTSVMNNLAAFQPLSATQQIVAGRQHRQMQMQLLALMLHQSHVKALLTRLSRMSESRNIDDDVNIKN